CLIQYILLVPSYVNILMIYAFCNTHDVSWGTKGDNINTGNLNGTLVTEEDDKTTIKINVIEEEDINAAYNNIIEELKNKGHEKKQHRNAFTKKDNYYRLFKTNLVLSWIFTNGLIIILFTSNTFSKYFSNQDYSGAYNSYLAFGKIFI
ncbi:13960_t:CDS:1, partial [Racocetra fulgida]